MIRLLSHAEQMANHLRDEILGGRWQGMMPGVAALETELGVNHTTIGQALALLETEGLLASQGGRRRRQIILPNGKMRAGMRVAMLLYEPEDITTPIFIEVYHRLTNEGITVLIPDQTLTGMSMNVAKVARVVKATKVDAWIALGASSDVLDWFANQSVPCLAYAGQFSNTVKISVIAPGREKSMRDLIQRLVDLGHKRIVLLTGSEAKPRTFIEGLQSHGIKVGDYNIPKMERTPEGLVGCLDSLFSITPPTALLIDEPVIYLTIQNELAHRGIFAPKDISLISLDSDPIFRWLRPTVAHIHWDMALVNRHIIRWVMNVSRGQDDKKRVYTNSVFVDGGTIGPVPIGK